LRKMLITALFVTSLVVANVVTGKILSLDAGFFNFIVPGAFLLYAVTFLMTDLMNELYGRKEAQTLVKVGFIASVFAAIMIYLTQLLPAAPFAMEVQEAYEILLGTNMRFVFASMIAYYLSQTWDVWFFSKLKDRTNGRHKWLRNNASTMTSQLLDTVIFITIAFIGTPGVELGIMVFSQYVLKLLIAAVDTPIFYLLTRNMKPAEVKT